MIVFWNKCPLVLICSRRNNTQTQLSRLFQSAPSHSPREIPMVRTQYQPDTSSIHSGRDVRDRSCLPWYYEQDIPKQLEGADIWCCALVLGPPQNGPVTWLFSACHWLVSSAVGQGPTDDYRKENLISIKRSNVRAMCVNCTHSCGVLARRSARGVHKTTL